MRLKFISKKDSVEFEMIVSLLSDIPDRLEEAKERVLFYEVRRDKLLEDLEQICIRSQGRS